MALSLPFTPALPIGTDRLVLRPFEPSDLDDLVALQSRPDVARYLYWEPRHRDQVAATLAERAGRRSLAAAGDGISLAVTTGAGGPVIGDVVVWLASVEHALAEVGYVLHPDHHGHGYATEAVAALVDLAVDGLGAHRVVGRLDARNAASARLLERLGFRREAHFVENEWVKGEWTDEAVYACLAREWRGLRAGGAGA